MSPALDSRIVPLKDVPCGDAEVSEALKRPLILVVDDETIVAETLGMILRRAGFGVMTAYNAAMGLQLAGALKPDLLLSDVRMPGMNGVDLGVAIRRALPHCKVVLLSGNATTADLTPAQEAGFAFSLLHKPVPPEEMLREVTEQLGLPPVSLRPSRINQLVAQSILRTA